LTRFIDNSFLNTGNNKDPDAEIAPTAAAAIVVALQHLQDLHLAQPQPHPVPVRVPPFTPDLTQLTGCIKNNPVNPKYISHNSWL
jgi:hypothetical protein